MEWKRYADKPGTLILYGTPFAVHFDPATTYAPWAVSRDGNKIASRCDLAAAKKCAMEFAREFIEVGLLEGG